MNKRLMTLALVAALSGLLGVGYAISGRQDQPGPIPDRNAPVALAGPDGEVLKCKGMTMKVKRSDLPGSKLEAPSLTGKLTKPKKGLSVTGFLCAKGADGKETGDVAIRVVDGATGVSVTTTVSPASG